MRTACTALALTALTILAPLSLHAQEIIRESGPYKMYGDYVLMEDGEGVTSDLIDIIASRLEPKLPQWPKTLPPHATVVQAQVKGPVIQDTPLLTLNVQVNGQLQPTEADLRKVWDLARKQLEDEINRVTSLATNSRQRRLRDELARLEAQRAESEAAATKAIEELAMRQAESAGADAESLAKEIAQAVSNHRGLQLENAGVAARREAIERRIDELRKVAEESAEKDPVLGELQKLVDIRRRQVENLQAQHAVGQRSALDMAEAEGQLATTLVEVAKARREASERAGGAELRALNDELSKLLIEKAKVEGQRAELEKVIVQLRDEVRNSALTTAAAANLRNELENLRQRRAELESRHNSLKRAYEEQSPRAVTLRPLAAEEAPDEE